MTLRLFSIPSGKVSWSSTHKQMGYSDFLLRYFHDLVIMSNRMSRTTTTTATSPLLIDLLKVVDHKFFNMLAICKYEEMTINPSKINKDYYCFIPLSFFSHAWWVISLANILNASFPPPVFGNFPAR